eukprot:scaffold1338_cov364-Prasinococcus_capsulatus_cf.AAC.5
MRAASLAPNSQKKGRGADGFTYPVIKRVSPPAAPSSRGPGARLPLNFISWPGPGAEAGT